MAGFIIAIIIMIFSVMLFACVKTAAKTDAQIKEFRDKQEN